MRPHTNFITSINPDNRKPDFARTNLSTRFISFSRTMHRRKISIRHLPLVWPIKRHAFFLSLFPVLRSRIPLLISEREFRRGRAVQFIRRALNKSVPIKYIFQSGNTRVQRSFNSNQVVREELGSYRGFERTGKLNMDFLMTLQVWMKGKESLSSPIKKSEISEFMI